MLECYDLNRFLIKYHAVYDSDFEDFESSECYGKLRLETDINRLKFQKRWNSFKNTLSSEGLDVFDDSMDVSRNFTCHLRIEDNLFLTVEVSLIGDFYSCFFSEISDFKVTLFKGNLDLEKESILINVQKMLVKYFNFSKVEVNDFSEIVPGVFVEGYYESSYGTNVHNILFGISKISIND